MGIRLHRVAGYGIQFRRPVTHKSPPQSYRPCATNPAEGLHERCWKSSEKEIIQFGIDTGLMDQDDKWLIESLLTTNKEKSNCAERYIHCIGMDEILGIVVRPLGFESWARYADDLDRIMYDEAADKNAEWAMKDSIHFSSTALWPFDSMMDRRTGARISYHQHGRAYFEWLFEHGDKPDDVAKELGYKSVGDYRKNVVPLVPGSVRAVAVFSGLFDKKSVLALRPCWAEWWS